MSCCASCETRRTCDEPRDESALLATLPPAPPAEPGESDGELPALELRCGRPVALNGRLAVSHQAPTASEALLLGRCVAGSVDIVVIKLSNITQVEAILQGGLDRKNWKPISSTVLTSEGYGRFRFRGQSYRFLRVWFSASGSAGGAVILSTTVNPAKAASA